MSISRTNSGKRLNKIWGVNARHALYRENGTFYHLLRYFVDALFDKNGYILFETKDDYLDYLSKYFYGRGEVVNCPSGIASLPFYVRV